MTSLEEKGIEETKRTMLSLKGWILVDILFNKSYTMGLYTFKLNKTVWLKDMEIGLVVDGSGQVMVYMKEAIDKDVLDMILETLGPFIPTPIDDPIRAYTSSTYYYTYSSNAKY